MTALNLGGLFSRNECASRWRKLIVIHCFSCSYAPLYKCVCPTLGRVRPLLDFLWSKRPCFYDKNALASSQLLGSDQMKDQITLSLLENRVT